MIVLLLFLLILTTDADAARRIARPVIGVPVGGSVTGGFAIDIKDCYVTTPYATAADTESSSGTMVSKPTGNRYDGGQIGCPVNVASGTYYAWVKVRLRGVTQVPQRVFWFDTTPFKSSFQNSKATLISSDVGLPPATSFDWRTVGADLNMATFAQGTVQTTFALGSGSVLYLMGDDVVELDCIFVSTSSSATPICPAGAPASGITHNATGTAAAASATSTLAPTITVAAGSNRILMAAVCHRTSTNTISSVSSSVDGAFTLVNWVANDTVAGAIYRLLNPTTGAHTVTVTFSQAQNGAAGLVAYNGVSQSAPTSTVSTSTGTGTPSLTVAGAADQFAVDHLCVSVDNAETVAVHASQTQRYQKEVDIAGGPNRVSAWSDQQGDTSVSMDWTITGTKAWAYQALMIKPPSGAGSPPVLGSPSVTLQGATSATVEASVDDASAQCEAEYDTNSGAPYASNTVDVGATGGKCIVTITGLTQSTPYFYRINATNAQGTTNGTEGTFNTTTATAVTALGITQAEIDIWNVRRVSGPYRVAGDVSTNSPGDWTRINSNASSFRAAGNTSERWTGHTAGGCWSHQSNPPALPGRSRGEKIRDTAFRFLLTGDTADRDAVVAGLLDQASQTGTDWTNSTKWNVGSTCLFGDGWSWEISMWLTKLIYAYDYIRHDISAGNKTTLDAWFTAAATLLNSNVHNQIATRFPNRDSDDYTTWGSGYPSCTGAVLTHYGGFTKCNFHEGWNNRSANHLRVVALVGIMTANTTFKNRAKRWVQEWVRFTHWADSTDAEMSRGIYDGRPGNAFHYTGLMVGPIITIADAFARIGDVDLYNYSTSLGTPDGSLVVAGGPKSILTVTQLYLNHVDGTTLRYATSNPANNGNANYLIDSVDQLFSESRNHDTYVAPGNVFWNNARVKSVYLRQASGAPAYPVSPANFGSCSYCGEWGVYPGVLFMFGQMEGLVDPYP